MQYFTAEDAEVTERIRLVFCVLRVLCGKIHDVNRRQESALLIVGHGSTVNPDLSAPTLAHATEIRRRNIFADVPWSLCERPQCLHGGVPPRFRLASVNEHAKRRGCSIFYLGRSAQL